MKGKGLWITNRQTLIFRALKRSRGCGMVPVGSTRFLPSACHGGVNCVRSAFVHAGHYTMWCFYLFYVKASWLGDKSGPQNVVPMIHLMPLRNDHRRRKKWSLQHGKKPLELAYRIMYTLWCSLSNALALLTLSLLFSHSPRLRALEHRQFFTVRNVLEEKRQRQGLLIPAGSGFKHHTCVAFRFRCRSLFISQSKVIHKNAIIVLSELCQLLFDSVVKRMARVWGSHCLFISSPFWPVGLLVRRMTDAWQRITMSLL